jgi:excisionase family DNA binding protein
METMSNRSIPHSDWLTAAEAAAYLRVQVRTVLLWARQGKVKAYALSGTQRHVWRFRACDLDAMLVGPSVPCSKGAQ